MATQETLMFKVEGTSRADARRRADEICRLYFGDKPYVLDVTEEELFEAKYNMQGHLIAGAVFTVTFWARHDQRTVNRVHDVSGVQGR